MVIGAEFDGKNHDLIPRNCNWVEVDVKTDLRTRLDDPVDQILVVKENVCSKLIKPSYYIMLP
jgi:hypothetical protein